MGACLILAPAIIASWPAITAAVAGAAAALGFNVAKELAEEKVSPKKVDQDSKVDIDVANSEVLQSSLAVGEQITMTQGKTKITFMRDEAGQLRVCVTGRDNHADLEAIGKQVSEKVTQMFIYNRIMSELKQKGFQIVDQEVGQDESVHLHVRNILN